MTRILGDRRVAPMALGVAIALLLLGLLVPLSFGGVADAQEVTTVEGGDNVQVAIELSRLTFPDGAQAAFLGRSDLFPDNLASGAGQGLIDSPLLLTESNALNEDTRAELERLDVRAVFVLGGENAISSTVEQELEDEGYTVERLEGETRIETAIDIARTLFPLEETAILARAFPATGGTSTDETQAFADSLAAGGWAADDGFPVLLTQTEVLTGNTRDYLEESPINQVFIVGGEAAISQTVEQQVEDLGITVERVEGPTRFDTAVAIAEARGFDSAEDAETTILIEGQAEDAWAAGFASAALADLADAPIVLANGDDLPQATRDFLEGGNGGGTGSPAAAQIFAQDSETPTATTTPTGSASPSASPSATATPTEEPTEEPNPICIIPIPFVCDGGEEPTGSESETGSPTETGTGGGGRQEIGRLVCVDVSEEACDEAREALGLEGGGSESASPTATDGGDGGEIIPTPVDA